MNESEELERQAVALMKQYGKNPFFPPALKVFFRRLAVLLKWNELEKAL
ncbi:hypothetical protein [Massilia sp. GCM10023247]